MKILDAKKYRPIIDRAYLGLKKYSTAKDGKYLIPSQVSGGTCIGGKDYYFKRKITTGTGFGIGSFIFFGLEYEGLSKL